MAVGWVNLLNFKKRRIYTAEKQERNRDADIDEIVDNMTLMDDDFMSKAFDGNIPATGRLLRTILGREDIEVISVVGQMELQNPLVGGRMIRLDIVVEDRDGVTCDIEVQRKKPDDMRYPELAECVRHFKEEKGRDSMCELVENYARQRAAAIIAEKEKVEAEKEKLEAEKEKVEAENEELRARLAQYETV